MNEVNEVSKVNEMNEVNKVNEVNKANKVNEVNEANKGNDQIWYNASLLFDISKIWTPFARCVVVSRLLIFWYWNLMNTKTYSYWKLIRWRRHDSSIVLLECKQKTFIYFPQKFRIPTS